MSQYQMFCSKVKLRGHGSIIRKMGGFITDYDLTLYGLELYRDLNGQMSVPPITFIIPKNDTGFWPEHLKGKPLGYDVVKHGIIVKKDTPTLNNDKKHSE